MTTPTDLPARVEEALDQFAKLDALDERSGVHRDERDRQHEHTRRLAYYAFPALAADWQRLRERERVLTAALQKIAGLDPTRAAVNMAATQAVSIARAALSPEPKT